MNSTNSTGNPINPNIKKFGASVCTLSWIDGKTRLPENDGIGPSQIISGREVTREDDKLPFRFLNLVEATISVIGARIISHGWLPASKIYQNPSFLKTKSEAFDTQRSISPRIDRVIFQQTVGARTVAPEVIGESVGIAAGLLSGQAVIGGKFGRAVAHELIGFPPIWTTVQLTLFADGRSESAVLCHSLFPSMSFYRLATKTAPAARGEPAIIANVNSREFLTFSRVGLPYDAVPNLEKWKTEGWGSLPTPLPHSGPCSGNPWQKKKSDLTARPVDSGRRTV